MERKGVTAVERALDILAVFDDQNAPLTISEIARRANLYKSRALRLIASLKHYGYITQQDDGRYHLGPTLLRLGTMYQRSNTLHDRILPVMRQLVAEGSESPSFFVRYDAHTRLCILRIDSRHATLDRVATGALLPLDKGAAGHVFHAFAGARGAKFAAIRTHGFATSFGERDPECAAVACPVFGVGHELIGVLSLSGPRHRFTEAVVRSQTAMAIAAAETLSSAFGGTFRGSLGQCAGDPDRVLRVSGD